MRWGGSLGNWRFASLRTHNWMLKILRGKNGARTEESSGATKTRPVLPQLPPHVETVRRHLRAEKEEADKAAALSGQTEEGAAVQVESSLEELLNEEVQRVCLEEGEGQGTEGGEGSLAERLIRLQPAGPVSFGLGFHGASSVSPRKGKGPSASAPKNRRAAKGASSEEDCVEVDLGRKVESLRNYAESDSDEDILYTRGRGGAPQGLGGKREGGFALRRGEEEKQPKERLLERLARGEESFEDAVIVSDVSSSDSESLVDEEDEKETLPSEPA